MPKLSFRAECTNDVRLFKETVTKERLPIQIQEVALSLGEVAVELTTNLPKIEIVKVLRKQKDSHVMIQTLRAVQMSENSLERDYSL